MGDPGRGVVLERRRLAPRSAPTIPASSTVSA